MRGRDDERRGGLRARLARGGLINAAFMTGAEALVLLQGLLATALLGPDAIGLYGIVSTTAVTIVALRRVGTDEAFVRHQAEDEQLEFQRAFTVELGLGLVAALLIAAAAPILAALYDDDQLLALTLAVAYLPIGFALQAPQWIFFRRMDYVRLRTLQAIVPLGTVLVATPLLLAGVGVWALVIGPFAGNALAVIAALRASPYPLALRPDREATHRYLRFSWPIFATSFAMLVVAQGQIALYGLDRGLAAAGWMTLAVTLTRYVDRADQIVATTIYPAIVRVRDRLDLQEELFASASRIGLLLALPFGAGLALFAGDLVEFVLGAEWEPAVPLIVGLALITAAGQVGYTWFSFYRAHGRPQPQAVESAVLAGTFLALAVPGALVAGTTGFLIGRAAGMACVIAVRGVFVRRLLPGVRLGRLALRAAVPAAVASAVVLAARLPGGERTGWRAAAELALWLGVLVVTALRLEGPLLRELRGMVRGEPGPGAPVAG